MCPMQSASTILSDLSSIRIDTRDHEPARRRLLAVRPYRPLADIAFDWVAIAAMLVLALGSGPWATVLAVLVIANRQRALGNILHDAGHRNLSRDGQVNDTIARLLVAPFVFSSLSRYRAAHLLHHQRLGNPAGDPDILPAPSGGSWPSLYARNLFSLAAWRGSILGDLASPGVRLHSRLCIMAWWGLLGAAVSALTDAMTALQAFTLWMIARATVFHAITTLREMCDHVGLRPGGIYSFTRDMACRGLLRWFIHPRNNGYHLTHHLCPAVPYYRLPEAQRLFALGETYRVQGAVCASYFLGRRPVVASWSTPTR